MNSTSSSDHQFAPLQDQDTVLNLPYGDASSEQSTAPQKQSPVHPAGTPPANSPHSSLLTPPLIDLRQYDQSWFDRGRPGWMILLWWFVQAVVFPLTPHSFHFARVAVLRLFGAKIGKGVSIRPTARFTYPWKVSIGDYSWIGDDVVLYSLDQITIGQHCVISQKSYLCTGTHDIHDPTFALETAPIRVGNGAWIATDCFIALGVEIGANAVIGARSVVLRSMPEQQICWGSPCQPRYLREMKTQG